MHDRHVWVVIFAGLLDLGDVQLQSDQAKGFARADGLALLVKRNGPGFKVEGVQVVVVEEADDTHPRAGHAVWVLCVE